MDDSIICFSLIIGVFVSTFAKELTFKAAVYELKPIEYEECMTSLCHEEKAMEMMMENVDKVKEATEEAARQGAKILVFPEYGITGEFATREYMHLFTQEISAEAQGKHVNLCDDSTEDGTKTKVLKEISCVAMTYEVYVVVNLATRVKCNIKTDKGCRSDGWYIYNTNVAFSKQGDLVAVYHKYHLYEYEVLTYDRPSQPEVVFFETEYGKIGTFICFDIAFQEPLRSLIEKGVKTIAFSAYWVDSAPIMTGIQLHSMVAYRNGINLLTSGNGFSTGSGIYSSDGVHGIFYEDVKANQSRLVVAEVPVAPEKQPHVDYGKFANDSLTPTSSGAFSSYFDTMPFQFKILKESGAARICHNEFCCESTYSKVSHTNSELYALAAYAGHHRVKILYIEMCAIIRCASSNPKSCGSPILNATQEFSHLTLAGTFTTNNVYSSILLDGVEKMDLAYDRMRTRDDGLMEYDARPGDGGLVCAQLLGSLFDRGYSDISDQPKNNVSSILPTLLCIYFSICLFLV